MIDLSQLKAICQEYGLAPQKSRGQNFLIDEAVIEKMMKVAKIESAETILEVGPGLGVLTQALLRSAKKVIAIELDRKAINFLHHNFAGQENLELVEGDVLKINLPQILAATEKYRVIANLPYNITSHFLRIFLELPERRPTEMILMVQKEVAERIVAQPGEMSKISVMIKFYSEPEILFEVSREAFWPKPKVDSAVIRLKLKDIWPTDQVKDFFRLVNFGFSAKRKQLHNNLAGGLKITNEVAKTLLIQAGFSEKVRAQELSLEDWLKLVKIANAT